LYVAEQQAQAGSSSEESSSEEEDEEAGDSNDGGGSDDDDDNDDDKGDDDGDATGGGESAARAKAQAKRDNLAAKAAARAAKVDAKAAKRALKFDSFGRRKKKNKGGSGVSGSGSGGPPELTPFEKNKVCGFDWWAKGSVIESLLNEGRIAQHERQKRNTPMLVHFFLNFTFASLHLLCFCLLISQLAFQLLAQLAASEDPLAAPLAAEPPPTDNPASVAAEKHPYDDGSGAG
jgi:hypothetical protein